jgi:hypothetical protein
MFNNGGRIIKVVKEFAPFWKPIRLPEPNGVILKGSPGNEQQITIRSLDTSVNLYGLETRRGGNQRIRDLQRLLKG